MDQPTDVAWARALAERHYERTGKDLLVLGVPWDTMRAIVESAPPCPYGLPTTQVRVAHRYGVVELRGMA